MKRLLLIIPATVLFFTLGLMSLAVFSNNMNMGLALVSAANAPPEPVISISVSTSSLSDISAKSYILSSISGNKVTEITKKESSKKLYIASISKLMTAVVAVENLSLKNPVEIKAEDINLFSPSLLFKIGDVLTGEELLKTLLIESNNDAAGALSRQLGTTTFVTLMNEKAFEMGMNDTVFSNPVGTDPENINDIGNISTAEDLLILSQYILKNHSEIFGITRSVEKPIVSLSGNFHHLASSTNQLLRNDDFPYIILGGKTGSTPFADKNLVLVYRKENLPNVIFVSVVLNSRDQFDDSLILAKSLEIKWDSD